MNGQGLRQITDVKIANSFMIQRVKKWLKQIEMVL